MRDAPGLGLIKAGVMRIVPALSALLVLLSIYLVVLERDALLRFAEGDTSALSEIALVSAVRGALAAETDISGDTSEGAPDAGNGTATTPGAQDDAAPQQVVGDVDTPAAVPEPEPERSVAVVAQHSTAQPIDRAVIVRGRTEATREVEVRAETSGRVISDPLRKGGSVERGQALCELDPGTRRVALAEAQARLAEAQLQYNAADRLSQDGFATETRAASARAALQGAEAAVAAAEAELGRLTINAPFEGLLETDTAELGALLQPGSLCATIVQLDPIRLVGFVPEVDVDKVQTGAMAGARLTSGREIAGRVSFVSRTAEPATRTFRVEVTVPNPDLSIRDGQTAEIGIAATGTDAHLVPGSALTLDDTGAIGLRTVDADNRAQFMPITVVRDSAQGLWVTGLPETVDLIVVGQEFVRDGVRVVPTFREAETNRAAETPFPGEAALDGAVSPEAIE